jgi:NADPH:quinone reductase-like Zn-dependent oxidoreductase
MRAIYLHSRGRDDSLVIGERPRPKPGPGQVRVRVDYAAFNRVDLYMRDSGAGITHELPLILGVDGSGHVDAVGAGVQNWQEGDAVVLYPARSCGHCEFCRRGEQMLCLSCQVIGEHIDGCFAEFVCADENMLFPLPRGMDPQSAVVLPTAYLTAWRMVMTQGRVAPADSVLIHGIGGGVSLASLQLAKLCGARVLATSSSEEKLQRARALGADALIDYRHDDVVQAVMQDTAGRGVDVVIDNVGEATWPASLRSVRRGGRVVTCGATSGAHPSSDLQRLFIRQIRVYGSTLGTQEEFRGLLAAAAGSFSPVVDRVFDFDAARDAFEMLDNAGQCGKLVLRIG